MPQFIDTVLFIFIIYCIYKRFSLKTIISISALLALMYWIGSHYLHLAYESHHKSDNFRYSNIYHLFII